MSEARELGAPRFDVTITTALIVQSEKRDSSHCMIADGVKLARPKARFVSVDIQTIRFSEKGKRYVYLTPRRAQVALVRFDQGLPTEAFKFQLRNGQSTSSHTPKKTVRAHLRKPRAPGAVPDKIGGRTPPRVPITRRSFGLRAMQL
jgi:hypothetical protein